MDTHVQERARLGWLNRKRYVAYTQSASGVISAYVSTYLGSVARARVRVSQKLRKAMS
jgi:hypothetical protein